MHVNIFGFPCVVCVVRDVCDGWTWKMMILLVLLLQFKVGGAQDCPIVFLGTQLFSFCHYIYDTARESVIYIITIVYTA